MESVTAGTPVAVVTGLDRGLGRSIAVHLARANVAVIGTCSGTEAIDEVLGRFPATDVPVTAVRLDGGSTADLAAFVEQVRRALASLGADHLQYLVNSPDTGTFAPFADTTEDQFDELVRIQFKQPFFLARALLPLIPRGGRIVNFSSGLVRFTRPGHAAYAATKGAIEVLTRYQAAELSERQIRVNVVVPGAVADSGAGRVVPNEAIAAVHEALASGDLETRDALGAAVAAILSDPFDWASGAPIELSGGPHL